MFALMAVVVLIVLLTIVIAGRTRKAVITSWKSKECTINWFIQLLDDSYFEVRHKQWAATGQGDEHLTDELTDVWMDIAPVRHSKYKKRRGSNELSPLS